MRICLSINCFESSFSGTFSFLSILSHPHPHTPQEKIFFYYIAFFSVSFVLVSFARMSSVYWLDLFHLLYWLSHLISYISFKTFHFVCFFNAHPLFFLLFQYCMLCYFCCLFCDFNLWVFFFFFSSISSFFSLTVCCFIS